MVSGFTVEGELWCDANISFGDFILGNNTLQQKRPPIYIKKKKKIF